MPPLKFVRALLLFGLLFALCPLSAQDPLRVVVDSAGVETYYLATGEDAGAMVKVNGEETAVVALGGATYVPVPGGTVGVRPTSGGTTLYHLAEDGPAEERLRRIPLWWSVVPPLLAILLALIFKEVVVSLFAGVWIGAFIASAFGMGNVFVGLFTAVLTAIDTYIIDALEDSGHLSVIVFSLLIGGMVAIISRNGGMAGVVNRLTKYARTPRSAQFITWLLGVGIFFDDYANTLIVGNTMRSVTDRFRISREKLAYLVDSTAAPVASVAFITTWIGAELGYIGDGIEKVPALAGTTPYAVFLESLKYSFYPVLTLVFMLFLIRSRRDFGPMHAAEVRARETGQLKATSVDLEAVEETEDLDPVAGAPLRARNAILPVLVVIIMTIAGLVVTGLGDQAWSDLKGNFFVKLGAVIGDADSYVALLWASISGVIVAVLLTVSQRIMNIGQSMGAMTSGFKSMFSAVLILTLAWALAETTEALHTADFLVDLLGDALNPYLLPPVIFILAALVSFSTGSSWSTMAILYPIAIPLAYEVARQGGFSPDEASGLLYNVISTVLAASVLGDHCSPISDTTILSSLAADCNHIDHVRTQLPYALTVGAVALVCGFLATLLGGGWPLCLALMAAGLGVLYGVVRWKGREVETARV